METISSFDDDNVQARAARVLFTSTFEGMARETPWACLKKQEPITIVRAAEGTPENPQGTTLPIARPPYNYEYVIPSDCLDTRYLVPHIKPSSYPQDDIPQTTASRIAMTAYPAGGAIPFETAYGTNELGQPIKVILTNLRHAELVYTVNNDNPDVWDSLFQRAMVARLAAYFVPALNLNINLISLCEKIASQAIGDAMASDGNEGINVMDHTPDWILARGAGVTYDMYDAGFMGGQSRP
jgi:hypothetical protein